MHPAHRSAPHGSAAALLAIVFALSGCDDSESAPPLPKVRIDAQRIAVAGFSSGAAMAQQAHFAYSDHVLGAALLAGPPYQCAEGSLEHALSRCLKGEPPAPEPRELAERIAQRAASGALAALDGLEGDRVLVAHGRKDTVVPEAITRASLSVYEALPQAGRMQLDWRGDGDFAHVWPTSDAGGDCALTAPPYIGRCGLDLAGAAMQALFGAPDREATAAAGTLDAYSQSGLLPDDEDAFLDATGFLYRPPQCDGDHACGLLIAFHGCEQNAAGVGEAFIRDAGFNRWADVHDVVVLYPQMRATYMPLNPKACWDWWGYSGPDYDTRRGVQLRWLAAAAAALGAPLR